VVPYLAPNIRGTSVPLSRASVVLHLNTAGDLAATAATESDGRFTFDNLPAGTYLLAARHTGFDTSWFGSCPLITNPSITLLDRSGGVRDINVGSGWISFFVT
jgi:Carboxypeptidase regulatory-like domain